MNGDQPQEKHRSEPPQGDQASGTDNSNAIVTGNDPSVMQGRDPTGATEATRDDAMQDANQNPEQASVETHVSALSESSGDAAAKESVQSIPLTLPQGGNAAEHLTPEQLFETDTAQRRTREVAIQPPADFPAREPVRYDTVLFAPKVPPMPPGDPVSADNTEPVGKSPFQPSGPESSDAQSVTDPEMPELPLSETDSSPESAIVPEGAEPALPASEASAQQQLPRRGDWSPEAAPQFQGIVQLSGPSPNPTAATASSSGSAATAPPQSPGSTTTQLPPAGEKAAPLPRVIVMVGLDDAEKIVHEEMRVFSRELAIVGRQIAQEETENLMFDFRAQINALLR